MLTACGGAADTCICRDLVAGDLLALCRRARYARREEFNVSNSICLLLAQMAQIVSSPSAAKPIFVKHVLQIPLYAINVISHAVYHVISGFHVVD